MTDKTISPLRRRMIEDMTIRKLTPKTQQGYIRTIKNLAAFIGRSPDKASFEDVRQIWPRAGSHPPHCCGCSMTDALHGLEREAFPRTPAETA
jgi:integrase/recombinase XerD